MAAGSPRRNTGPGGQSICGERMRSPAPGQRLQVTGGILKFTIYQGPFVEGCRSAKKRGGAKFWHTGFQLVFWTACIRQVAESQQSCSAGVQTTPPADPHRHARWDVDPTGGGGVRAPGCRQVAMRNWLSHAMVEMVNKWPHLTSINMQIRYLKSVICFIYSFIFFPFSSDCCCSCRCSLK